MCESGIMSALCTHCWWWWLGSWDTWGGATGQESRIRRLHRIEAPTKSQLGVDLPPSHLVICAPPKIRKNILELTSCSSWGKTKNPNKTRQQQKWGNLLISSLGPSWRSRRPPLQPARWGKHYGKHLIRLRPLAAGLHCRKRYINFNALGAKKWAKQMKTHWLTELSPEQPFILRLCPALELFF